MKQQRSSQHFIPRCLGLVPLLLLCTACSDPPESKVMSEEASRPVSQADSLYINGRVYTVDEANPWVEAIAVNNGVIVALGSTEEIMRLVGEGLSITDLAGRMVMPGIHDMHLHPSDGGIKGLLECGFPSSLSLDEMLGVVAGCAANQASGEWIRGGQWPLSALESDRVPDKSMLDQITTEHPIFLMDWSVHHAWVNSKALEVLGIDMDTPDPDGGVIVRDPETGEATGILLDNAAYAQRGKLPEYSLQQYKDALAWSMEQFTGFGITSIKDAIVTAETMAAYHQLDVDGQLPTRLGTHLSWRSEWARSHQSELELIADRESFESDRLQADFAKIMLDGVPLSYTAALLEPYAADEEHGANFRGELMFAPELLNPDVTMLDAEGLTIKIHATGDASVRAALDAIEMARQENGDSGLLHEISHAQMIHADDIPRFAELNVAAEMCPILWYPNPSDEARIAILGEERANQFWPVRSLVKAGALVFYGSDWPAVVPDANPWPGLEAMVTRRNPYDETYPGENWPEEAVDLETAIRIFTINGARTAKSDNLTGSIEVGKAADFIVLDQDLFEISEDSISDTGIVLTVVDGKRVYDQM